MRDKAEIITYIGDSGKGNEEWFWCDEEVFKLVRGGDGRILHFKIADCVHCEFHLNKKQIKGPEKVNMEYRMDLVNMINGQG